MPRAPQAAQAPTKTEYHIIDRTSTSIAGQKIAEGQKTIELTEAQASFYIASGAISTEAPGSNESAEQAVEQHNAGEGHEAPPPAAHDAQQDGGGEHAA